MIRKMCPWYLHFLIAVAIATLTMPIALAVSGPPTFLPVVTYSPIGGYPTSVTLADLNGDSNLDMVVAVGLGGPGGNGLVNAFLGNGNGTFQAPLSYDSGSGWPTAVKVADVNGDGIPDVIVTNCGTATDIICPSGPSFVGVLLGNGNGTLRPVVLYPSGGTGALSLSIADVNRDSMPDIVVANEQGPGGFPRSVGVVAILFGNGDGSFQAPVAASSEGAHTVSVEDVNADGNPDLIVLTGGSRIEVLLGNGHGAFGSPSYYLAPGIMTAFAMTVADLNNDRKLDIAVVGLDNWTQQRLGILLGNGDGSFIAGAKYPPGGSGFGTTPVTVADLNGDGAPDIAVGGYPFGVVNPCGTADGIVGVLIGTGLGTFRQVVTSDSGGAGPASLARGDLNGDGKPDLVVANFFGSSVGILLNNTVPFGYPTSISLTSSLNPSIYGQKITFTARVTTSGQVQPTGTVVFMLKYFTTTYTIGTASLNSDGAATLTKSNLNAYLYPVTAVYKGDANNAPSTSPVLNQYVRQTTTAATLASSPNPSTVGQAVTFTAKITSPTVTPTGPGNSNIARSSAAVTRVVQP